MSSTTAVSPVSTAPKRAGLVLATLILAAFVCNLNLSVANVALPDIGATLSATGTQLTLIATGCTLGLAMSVLYFGAVGDRYGRKMMLSIGLALTVPASILSAWAPNANILIGGRVFTGLAAGMAYPTTLALITALWGPGKARIKAIALWSAVSGGGAIIGPVIAGFLLEGLWWGSVFLIVTPVAALAFALVMSVVPAHVNESRERIDHIGGVLSVIMIASLVLGLALISAPGERTLAVTLLIVAVLGIGAFVIRQRRATSPLYDLAYAKRRIFWVAGLAGMIIFGTLMGTMFVGQQFLQNVLGYSTAVAGLVVLPSGLGMIAVAPRSAKLVMTIGSRATMLLGFACIFPATLIMILVWREGTNVVWVCLAYLLIGCGAGLALTPASQSLTSSVPVARVGMASGTSDLQRDLGGSIMQAILGSMLTLGYGAAFAKQIVDSGQASQVSEQTQAALQQSYSSAAALAQRYPDYAAQIISAAKTSFLDGARLSYIAAGVAVLLGAAVVAVFFPKHTRESTLLEDYRAADAAPPEAPAAKA